MGKRAWRVKRPGTARAGRVAASLSAVVSGGGRLVRRAVRKARGVGRGGGGIGRAGILAGRGGRAVRGREEGGVSGLSRRIRWVDQVGLFYRVALWELFVSYTTVGLSGAVPYL